VTCTAAAGSVRESADAGVNRLLTADTHRYIVNYRRTIGDHHWSQL